MRKTTVAIDDEVIKRAGKALGTSGIKKTIDAALAEAIRGKALDDLIAHLKELDDHDVDVIENAWSGER